MKKLLLIIMLLVLSSVAFAGQCYVGGDCYVQHVVDDAEFDQVFVNITTSANATYSVSGNMTILPTGNGSVYYYLFQPEVQGNHSAFIQVFNNSIEQSNETKDFYVDGNNALRLNTCPTSIGGQIALWAFVIIAFLLIGFAAANRIDVLGIIASILLACSFFYVAGCSVLLGTLLAGCGIILVLYFAIRD